MAADTNIDGARGSASVSERALANAVGLGDVGSLVQKKFGKYGWHVGKVTNIRQGAENGKDRRVVYEDGDVEDYSLAELRKLDQTARAANTRRKRRTQRTTGGENVSARSTYGVSPTKRVKRPKITAD